jgi:hypothetical protein
MQQFNYIVDEDITTEQDFLRIKTAPDSVKEFQDYRRKKFGTK